MFVSFDREVPISLTVVTLGITDRLIGCLDALVGHRSRHDFSVSAVVNATGPAPAAPGRALADGVEVVYAAGNLGWAGGLQRGRSLTDADLLVWVQDDMTPEPGWLDAMVEAAERHPEVGAFGTVRVGGRGEVLLNNAGDAWPVDDVRGWSGTDRTDRDLPVEVTTYDWVTSKGLLTRAVAFDEVGGPDPTLFPIFHVDKDYSTHLRCHGWDVALVPGGRVRHEVSQSSSTALRAFLGDWRDGVVSERWAAAVHTLGGRSSGRVAHPCARWREVVADPVEVAIGMEASRMLVPFMSHGARAEAALHASAVEANAAAQAALADATRAYEAMREEAERLRAMLEQRDAR